MALRGMGRVGGQAHDVQGYAVTYAFPVNIGALKSLGGWVTGI